jgi:hypothetical protein
MSAREIKASTTSQQASERLETHSRSPASQALLQATQSCCLQICIIDTIPVTTDWSMHLAHSGPSKALIMPASASTCDYSLIYAPVTEPSSCQPARPPGPHDFIKGRICWPSTTPYVTPCRPTMHPNAIAAAPSNPPAACSSMQWPKTSAAPDRSQQPQAVPPAVARSSGHQDRRAFSAAPSASSSRTTWPPPPPGARHTPPPHPAPRPRCAAAPAASAPPAAR